MKIKRVKAFNFGSYETVDFDFDSQGLTLIQGTTGSGKSTLFDLVVWALYGITAKGGAVDEVRNWSSEHPTMAVLEVDDLTIVRKRGKANENDLYWTEAENHDDHKRGKDLQDTQRALTERLGISSDIYCAAAYFNEFSPQNSFFISTPKAKRQFLESIIDFSLSVKLAEKTTERRKELKASIVTQGNSVMIEQAKIDQLKKIIQSNNERRNAIENQQQLLLQSLQLKSDNFRTEKANNIAKFEIRLKEFESNKANRIAKLSGQIGELQHITGLERCPACKQKINATEHARLTMLLETLTALQDEKNPVVELLSTEKARQNHYIEQIAAESKRPNPYDAIIKADKEIYMKALSHHSDLKEKLKLLESKFEDNLYIYDLSFELRGVLLENALIELQDAANSILERHFDSVFRIDLSVVGADNLTVKILRNADECSYTQLSKGQRCILKLAFSIGLMQMVGNRRGIQSNVLFFDEALEGLDSELKVKAFGLFQELSKLHQNVYVIDHSPELQQMFSSVYTAELVNGHTELERQS